MPPPLSPDLWFAHSKEKPSKLPPSPLRCEAGRAPLLFDCWLLSRPQGTEQQPLLLQPPTSIIDTKAELFSLSSLCLAIIHSRSLLLVAGTARNKIRSSVSSLQSSPPRSDQYSSINSRLPEATKARYLNANNCEMNIPYKIMFSEENDNKYTPKDKSCCEPLQSTFQELKIATGNFRPDSILGEGGFGYVFKGWIEENSTTPAKPGTGVTVAVKSLKSDALQGHREWVAEIDFLRQLCYPNLIKLIGSCIEGDQRLIVYEFMRRGSLENHLFRRHLTSKSDVYSFGVVLLEILTGRRSIDKKRPHGEQSLVAWARPYLGDKRRFSHLVDPHLELNYSLKGVQKVAQIANHCLNKFLNIRPSMDVVVKNLLPLQDLNDLAYNSFCSRNSQQTPSQSRQSK